ncbi:unnamed protein product [Clavelina lepadiformis]|uniref:Protein-PII uridylyltransferase N-terminal domain-containing protein n=1 Tax=Clavelina lepadiformis TaxID=159417 RepID=A0ABP0G533_CLALP
MAEEMREETRENLQQLTDISYEVKKNEQISLESQKIENVKKIQSHITQTYIEIMKIISQEDETIMGHLPCKFAIAGMGSLARCEITPYSDFEHIILQEEGAQENKESFEEVLEHFHWR